MNSYPSVDKPMICGIIVAVCLSGILKGSPQVICSPDKKNSLFINPLRQSLRPITKGS